LSGEGFFKCLDLDPDFVVQYFLFSIHVSVIFIFEPCQIRQWIDTRKLPWIEKTINTVESKSVNLPQMETFYEASTNKHYERDIHIHIKEMHAST
jgi:hypothetical protein